MRVMILLEANWVVSRLLILALLSLLLSADAFHSAPKRFIREFDYARFQPYYFLNTPSLTKIKGKTQLQLSSPRLNELSEEGKANLFQALLRDLQIEGVPLLGCDSDAVHTMNAALWTTMAELSAQDEIKKTCLIMENIPISALTSFVEDYLILKTQDSLISQLPELKRINVSLLGGGIGSAILIEAGERTEEQKAERDERTAIEPALNEEKCTDALKAFINRIVIGLEACPYTKEVDKAAVGLAKKGIPQGPVAYRYSGSTEVCAVIGAFWNCVCELLSTPQEDLSTTMLSLPGIGVGNAPESHARFSAVTELITRNLCLFRGDQVFGLVYFHPAYERNLLHPVDKPAYGHLPPQKWLPHILRKNGNSDVADKITDDELELSNYQRRSPFTAINILRAQQLDAASGPYSIVDLDIGGGVTEKASGIATYSRNAIRMSNTGENSLKEGVEKEIAMAFY